MRKLLSIVFLLLLFALPSWALKKRVLVLHSYHQGLNWTDNVTKGIQSVFENQKEVELQFDYLDSKRNIGPEYLGKITELYRLKQNESKFDAIIAVDNNALHFLKKNREELFPNTPIVFCAINNFSPDMIQGMDRITGIKENNDFNSTLQIMLRLHPQLDTIMVINDYHTTTALRNREKIEGLIPNYQSKVEIQFLEDLPVQDLLKKVEVSPANKAIFLLNFSKDSEGKFISYMELLRLLKENTKLPIYSSWLFFLNEGIVGGMLSSGYKQGEKAAQIACNILSGAADKLPPISEGHNQFYFDYRELQQFGIATDNLPKNSVIINQPPSFYSTYEPLIWLCIAFSFLMLALLYISSYFQRQKAKRLLEINLELDNRVERRTSELLKANQTLVQQQKKIISQKEELEKHRHNLLELVKERTSDLEEANQKLNENHSRLRFMLDANSDGVWEFNVNTNTYTFGKSFWEKLGYPNHRYPATEDLLFNRMHPNDYPHYQQELENYIQGEIDAFNFEFRLKNTDGNWLWFSSKGKSIENDKYGNPKLIVGTFLNISARKQAEEQEKEKQIAILNVIWETEEKERGRLAKDLHDGIGPILSSIKLAVSALKKAKTEARKEEVMEVTQEAINEAIISTKEIANNLSPHILRDFGLAYAYQNFIRKFELTSGLTILLNHNLEEQRFDHNIEIVFYRIFTELLNNTLKHAQAKEVKIDLLQRNSQLILNFEDDGIGITQEHIEMYWETGMGLSNIGNRIHSVRGKYEIKSKPNEGFKVYIEVPLPEQTDK